MLPSPPDSFHFLVIGPGALGCLFASSLCLGGFRVSLYDYKCDRAAELREEGITQIRGAEKMHAVLPVFCRPADIPKPDVLFLCVKSTGVQTALQEIACLLQHDNLLITLQNGIGHPAIVDRFFPSLCWAAGVTALGANLQSTHEVVFAGSGRSRFGFLKGCPEKQQQLLQHTVAALNVCGFESKISENIEAHIWEKLLINVGINALTAIYDCCNGDLLIEEKRRNTLRAAVLEAAAVAEAKGITLAADPVEQTLAVCKATAANLSSMLQDVRRCRRTEIDAINGAIVRMAQDFSIAVPVNTALTDQVKKMEQTCGGSRG